MGRVECDGLSLSLKTARSCPLPQDWSACPVTCDGGVRIKTRRKKCAWETALVRTQLKLPQAAGAQRWSPMRISAGLAHRKASQSIAEHRRASQSIAKHSRQGTPPRRISATQNPVRWIAPLACWGPNLSHRASIIARVGSYSLTSRWEQWGDCSTSCGVGQRFRTRAGASREQRDASDAMLHVLHTTQCMYFLPFL